MLYFFCVCLCLCVCVCVAVCVCVCFCVCFCCLVMKKLTKKQWDMLCPYCHCSDNMTNQTHSHLTYPHSHSERHSVFSQLVCVWSMFCRVFCVWLLLSLYLCMCLFVCLYVCLCQCFCVCMRTCRDLKDNIYLYSFTRVCRDSPGFLVASM